MAKDAAEVTVTERRTAFLNRLRSSAAEPVAVSTTFPAAVQAGPLLPPSRERRQRALGDSLVTTDQVLLAAVLVVLARYTAQWELSIGFVASDSTVVRSLAVVLNPQGNFPSAVKQVERALAVPSGRQADAATLLRMGAGADLPVPPACFLVEITGATVAVEHDPACHEPAVVDGFLRHVEALLNSARVTPGKPLAELPILDDADLAATVDLLNRTALARNPGTLVDAFEASVALHGERTALGDWRGTVSYAELAAQAHRLAHELLDTATLQREDLVAILVTRGDLRWVSSCVGALCAGGAWLPIDPDTPKQRVATLLAEAGVRAVVTDSLLRERIPAGPWQIIDLDADTARINARPATPPEITVDPGNLAYAIYTSGSTGKPRAVLVEHDSALNFTESMQRLFALRPDDRLVQFASPGFDVSVFEIFSTLLTGAFLWITGDNERLSVEGLSRLLEKERITVAELPPVLLEMMEPGRFPHLRLVSVGGEPFSGALATRWAAGRRFINGYGPTEATVAVTFHECQGEWRSTPPIGLPGDNHRAYVLGDDLRPVPVGAVGELYLAGAGLARGYLGFSGITADRFRPDPFSANGGRLYRTGDLVRRAPGGELVFVARRDRQVKVRGQRVELGEVESALLALPEVRSAVVDVVKDSLGQSSLTGYVVPALGKPLSLEALREFLGTRLPAYMVPSRLIEVSAIPRTRNGKVDLTALASQARDTEPAGQNGGDAGLTTLETRLRDRCYAVALPGVAVPPEADFFALGGTSLQAIRLMSLVRKLAGTEVALAEFFRRPTLRALATAVETKVSS